MYIMFKKTNYYVKYLFKSYKKKNPIVALIKIPKVYTFNKAF